MDREGVVYILFEHKKELRDTRYSHLGRISTGGTFEIWMGPEAVQNQSFIGEHSRSIAVAADGHIYVGNGFKPLRKISPHGKVIWRSPGTAKSDESELEELAQNRKGKKTVEDRG